MRIAEVARQFHPKIGGIESCVLNVSRGLIDRGHRVKVVTLDRDLRTGNRLSDPSPIDSLPVERISYFGSARYPIAPSWLNHVRDCDVIHIHAIDFFVDSAAVARVAGLLRQPVIVTSHGGIFHTTAWAIPKRVYWRYILGRSLRAVTKVVAVSESDAGLFREIVPPEKLVTIPNGVDEAYGRAQSARVRGRIVCAGRVSKAKAIDRVIQLVSRASDLVEELVIAGPDEDGTRKALELEAARLGIAPKVRFVGELSLSDLANLVSSAHLVISAAPHEGFGITTVEALSAGVPVMVSRTGIHEEIVRPGDNGWFWLGAPDAEALAVLRQALLLPDARLDEMRIAARESARRFSWDPTIDRYEQVLESAYRQSRG
jgi:alpha-1,3-mannosyltransferase